MEEEDEEQPDLDQNDSLLNANLIFENNIMALEYLRAPRLFLRPGSRAYSVPANLGKLKFMFSLMIISWILVSSISIVLPSMQTKNSTKFSKRSSSSKTSQRKSLPKEEDNNSSNDPNEHRSLSIFSSAKMRYFEDADHAEDNDDIGDLGLEIQSSSTQLKYKFLGM